MTDTQKNPDTSAVPVAQGLIVVVSAPSGAGKTSVLNRVLDHVPDAAFSVSVTTRPPRPGEIDGSDYHFVGEQEFERYIEAGEFVEWAEVHGNRYGTLKRTIDEAVGAGHVIVLDTDTVGAANIKRHIPDAVLVFIAPPTPDALKERLVSRNTDSEEVIRRRLEAAPREIRHMDEYDYIVVNDTLDEAAWKVVSIIKAEKLRTKRILPSLHAWRGSW